MPTNVSDVKKTWFWGKFVSCILCFYYGIFNDSFMAPLFSLITQSINRTQRALIRFWWKLKFFIQFLSPSIQRVKWFFFFSKADFRSTCYTVKKLHWAFNHPFQLVQIFAHIFFLTSLFHKMNACIHRHKLQPPVFGRARVTTVLHSIPEIYVFFYPQTPEQKKLSIHI